MSATAPKANGRAPRALAPAVETPGGLMDALLAVQDEAPKLARDATGQIQNRTYKYVTLGALVEKIGPLLTKHRLVWVTLPTFGEDGAPALTYRLTHVESGEAIEDTMPLLCAKLDPQGAGSAITYMRRYALTAILNLTADEDDDGARASATAAQPSATPAKGSERPASAKQRALIEVRARERELTAEQLADVLKRAGGEEAPASWQDGAAERWSKRALDRLPARLVDPVLEGIAR